jgi:hypothetical protein
MDSKTIYKNSNNNNDFVIIKNNFAGINFRYNRGHIKPKQKPIIITLSEAIFY